MPKVSITINRSSEVIWDYFMKLENWRKWWGASISSVNPGWENGARLTWENGDKSDLPVVRDQEEIQMSSMFMKTAVYLKPKSKQTTLVEYAFNPSGGASFSDGGRAHQATVEKKLAKLKDCVENETVESTESVPKNESDRKQEIPPESTLIKLTSGVSLAEAGPDQISLEDETKKCPACAETIKLEAKKCRFCGTELDPPEEEPVAGVVKSASLIHKVIAGVIAAAAFFALLQITCLITVSDSTLVNLAKVRAKVQRDSANPPHQFKNKTDTEIDQFFNDYRNRFIKATRKAAVKRIIAKGIVAIVLILIAWGVIKMKLKPTRILSLITGIILLLVSMISVPKSLSSLKTYSRLDEFSMFVIVDFGWLILLPLACIACFVAFRILKPAKSTITS